MQASLEKKNPSLDCRHEEISATLSGIIYCIDCLEQSKIHMWKLYLSLINNSRCYSTFQDIIKYPIPVRLTSLNPALYPIRLE